MATLQGLSFTNLNITPVFLIGILLSLTFVLIGNKPVSYTHLTLPTILRV